MAHFLCMEEEWFRSFSNSSSHTAFLYIFLVSMLDLVSFLNLLCEAAISRLKNRP